MRAGIVAAIVLAALATAGCKAPVTQATVQAASDKQIAWREGDVDDAFVEAKESGRPVLLYWGAKWCPPCNLMKQTLFKDADFIAETRNFIPVHLDGDSKGAQSWGQAFGVSGYPTVIILRPDRSEVTRLAGGATAGTLADVLKVAARRTTSTEDLLKRTDEPASLSPDDWRLLASFDWFDDPKHFGDTAKSATFVARLAAAAPDPATRNHFALTALALGTQTGKVTLDAAQQAQVRTLLPAIFADYRQVKANRQELTGSAPGLIAALPDPAERNTLGGGLVAALDRVAADGNVPLGDRISTVSADIALAKAAHGGKVDPAVLAKVRQRVAMADRAATDPAMRQAVMPTAGQVLADAGDVAGAQRLWKGELGRSVAPYYYMADLADLAETSKDYNAAIAWLKQAATTAEGPATRVQWAILYSQGVLRMRPTDAAAVEASAGMVIDALGQNSAGYAARTERKAKDWAGKLRAWGDAHDGAVVMGRLRDRITRACGQGRCTDPLTA